jgi:plastocyanin
MRGERIQGIGVLIALAVAAGAFGSDRSGQPAVAAEQDSVVEIEIREYRFRADTVRVPLGATVRWTNRDRVAHTSTAENEEWKSPLLGPGESFAVKLDQAGTFPYYCTPHPFMRGVVVVSPASR